MRLLGRVRDGHGALVEMSAGGVLVLCKAVLGTRAVDGRHTHDRVAASIAELLFEYGLVEYTFDAPPDYLRFATNSRVVSVTSDNGSNMVACANLLSSRGYLMPVIGRHVRCVAHTLQLIVSDLKTNVPALTSALTHVKTIVTYFHHSETLAMDTLRKTQAEAKIAQHRLVQSVPTRWDSDLAMCVRFVEQWTCVRDALKSIANNLELTAETRNRAKDLRKLMTEDMLALLKLVIPLLEPVAALTTDMQSSSQAISALVVPRLWSMYVSLFPLTKEALAADKEARSKRSAVLNAIYDTVVTSLRTSLEERFGFTHHRFAGSQNVVNGMNPLFVAVLMADPRTKDYHKWAKQPQERTTILNKFYDCLRPMEPLLPSLGEPTAVPITDEERERLLAHGGQEYVDEVISQRNAVAQAACRYRSLDDEVTDWLASPGCSIIDDPLVWWAGCVDGALRSAKFPRVFLLFQCIGCVQPTSAESERVFSTGSLTVSDLRKCLSAEHVDALIFLKRNIGDLGWQNADEWIPAVRAGFTNEDAVAAAMRS